MAGKFSFSPEEYQQAAHKYRSELLYLPIFGCKDTLKYMTSRPGIRYKESVGTLTGDAQFAPYNPKRAVDFNLDLTHRTLETYFGSVVANFEPNSAISTLLGTGATKGDGQMSTPTAKHVLALIARGLSEHLNDAIWNGIRNANGDTTKDLFDGFDTITAREIKAGNISDSKKNYAKLNEDITVSNVIDVFKDVLWGLDPHLRAKDLIVFCPQYIVDFYNEAYMLTHSGLSYNTAYNQTSVEGSNNRMTFIPLPNKADSKLIHITTKSNMLVGFDQMSDLESIMVKEYAPFVLSYVATMFFGVQFLGIESHDMFVLGLNGFNADRQLGQPV